MAFIKASQLIALALCLSTTLGFVAEKSHDEAKLSNLDEIIDHVNNAGSTWTAGRNFHPDISGEELQGLVSEVDPLGHLDEKARVCDCNHSAKAFDEESFDPRQQWKFCPSLSHISNQGGGCKSSWAVAAADVIADRQCIATKGEVKSLMSAQQLLTCCSWCGDCNGGWPAKAFQYYRKHGLVTGGDYKSEEGCQPFAFEPASNFNTPGDDEKETPTCSKQCTNKRYPKNMKKDLHFGASVITPCCCSITDVLKEGGPIVTSMVVYEDFFTYKSGVYRHIWGKKVGYQSARLLGWGSENGVPYWLVANSWGKAWGDNGLFKILRMVGECGFEYGFSAPVPKIKKH